jgi:hypothetical protein
VGAYSNPIATPAASPVMPANRIFEFDFAIPLQVTIYEFSYKFVKS